MATITFINEKYYDMLAELKEEFTIVEKKYSALADTIKGLEKLIEVSEIESSDKSASEKKPPIVKTLPHGIFDGLENKDAALKAVFLLGEPTDTRGIVKILETSGFQHNSNNIWNTVNTTLTRLQQQGKINRNADKQWFMNEDQIINYKQNENQTFFDHLDAPPAG